MDSTETINASKIMTVGMGFMSSKVLLSAINLELFSVLGDEARTGRELGDRLHLHDRGIADFLDALVALGFLQKEGTGRSALYRNTTETAYFLNKNKPEYIGGILEMANDRLYGFWNHLPEALKTGKPQNEVKDGGASMFEKLYADTDRLEQFMRAMAGISRGNFQALVDKFNFSKYKTLCDVGGATGLLSSLVAKRYPHIKCRSFDLPQVEPIAKKFIAREGLNDHVEIVAGDFFKDPLPKSDVITMGLILHDWNLENKKHLIQAAYDALPEDGVLIAVENLIDDDRRENAFGLLMSLNMLIEFGDAFDYTGADFREWCSEIGFRKFSILHLAGPCSAAIAFK